MPQTTNAQFKHDIGLKFNVFDQERVELEYRWHPNEQWNFLGGITAGTRNWYYADSYDLTDTTVMVDNYYNYRNYYGVSVGASRNLNFMKHNFYYVGSKLGFGMMQGWVGETSLEYLESDMLTSTFSYGEPLSYSTVRDQQRGYFGTARLFVGADFPILDRLHLKVELGGLLNMMSYKYNGSAYVLGQINMTATAGLRYNFGKVSE